MFISGVSGNVIAQKNTQRLELILNGNKIKYTQVDISVDENNAQKELMISKSKSATPRVTPQLFLNGEYVADFKQVDEWNEYEELKQNL